MSSRRTIRRFLLKVRVTIFGLAFIKGCMRALPIVLGGFLILSGLDYMGDLPTHIRQIVWLIFMALACLALMSGFWPWRIFSLTSASHCLSTRDLSGRLRVDEFRLAKEFSGKFVGDGVSAELQEKYLDDIGGLLSGVCSRWAYPRSNWKKWLIMVAIFVIFTGSAQALFPHVFMLRSRVLFPFATSDLIQWLSVHPGDATVGWGADVAIKITLHQPSLHRPVLFTRVGRDWDPVNLSEENGVLMAQFKGLVEPLEYRVNWKNEWSRKYIITPIKPIALQSIHIRIRPPEYTMESEKAQSNPEIRALAGSEIRLEVNAGQTLRGGKILFSDETEKIAEVSGGSHLQIGFVMEKEGFYRVSLHTEKGDWNHLKESYPLHLINDDPPRLTLLSPDQDLLIGDKEKIPLTFEAADDFGLSSVIMEWEKGSVPQYPRTLWERTGSFKNILTTYEWNLGDEQFSPGSIIRYRLEARDRNTVTGPGVGKTPWRMLEIQSFEKSHEDLEGELEAWRDQALEELARVNALESKIAKDPGPLSKYSADQVEIKQANSKLFETLRRIVDRMEKDPLADYGTWLEHKSIQDNLDDLNQSLMRSLTQSFQNDNKVSAQKELAQLGSELERMMALSDETSREQRAKDVLESGYDLASRSEDLFKEIQAASQENKPINAEVMKQIRQIMAEAQKILQDIATRLQKVPQDLPEDFVNQPALKQIDLGQAQDLLSQIQDALAKGDVARAMSLAKSFLDQARSIQSQLSKAHDSYESGGSAEELGRKIAEEEKKLDEITDRQMEILGETQQLDLKRIEANRQDQQKLLDDLALRQKKVVQGAIDLMDGNKVRDEIRSTATAQLTTMKMVEQEFITKKVEKSFDWLNQIITAYQSVEQILLKSTTPVYGLDRFTALSEEEKSIQSLLKGPSSAPDPFNRKDGEVFGQLQQRQSSLQGETDSLRKRVQMLSRKTASLGINLNQSLGNAGEDMGQASRELGRKASQPAFQAEESALHHLMEAQMAMQDALQAISGLGQQQGRGGSGRRTLRAMPRSSSGMEGAQSAPVKLPSVEDYKPPRAFREELLKALKEKYPQVYEDVIHKYYKRLSQ